METLVKRNENGQVVTTSLLVAEKFGKEHRNVLQNIRNLTAENSAVKNMFVETTYVSDRRRNEPMFVITRDGFSLLVMGFTGKDALKFKLDFIEAFNKMEANIKELQKPLSQIELIIQSAQLLAEQEKRVAVVEAKIEEIDTRTKTRPDYFTVAAYARIKHIAASSKTCSIIGRKAARICCDCGYEVGHVTDDRWGYVNSYPSKVLEDAFNMPL